MQMVFKKWGNGTGLLFSKDFLQMVGLSVNDAVDAQIEDGKIILTPKFRHRSLKERAEEYGGELNLVGEIVDWGEPVGRELW